MFIHYRKYGTLTDQNSVFTDFTKYIIVTSLCNGPLLSFKIFNICHCNHGEYQEVLLSWFFYDVTGIDSRIAGCR